MANIYKKQPLLEDLRIKKSRVSLLKILKSFMVN